MTENPNFKFVELCVRVSARECLCVCVCLVLCNSYFEFPHWTLTAKSCTDCVSDRVCRVSRRWARVCVKHAKQWKRISRRSSKWNEKLKKQRRQKQTNKKEEEKEKKKEVNDRVTGYSPGDYAVPRLAIYRWPCTSTSRLDHHWRRQQQQQQ